eukprot:jgi/Chrzof1/3074/Cz12g10220.t1
MPSTGFVKRGVAFRTTPTRVVVMRSENNSKMVREYREDDDKIVVPEESSSQAPGAPQGALYADEVPPAMAKPKDNMSKEMKARLRKEYVGLGGAENAAMSGNYFVWISVFVAVLAILSKLTGAI